MSRPSGVKLRVKAEKKTLGNLLPTLFGFFICGYIGWSQSIPAKFPGGLRMGLGILYGAFKTKGLPSERGNFDMPTED